MTPMFRNIAWSTVLVLLAGTTPAMAQHRGTASGAERRHTRAKGVLTLQATGTFATDGKFAGTITINRFEERAGRVVAIGFVQGTLSRGGGTATGLAGEVIWPVVVTAGGVSLANGRLPSTGHLSRVGWSPSAQPAPSIIPAQADACPVVQIALGPLDVNLLGAVVSLSPVALNLVGESGTPLGGLVCQVSELLVNVTALVGVLNGILGLLTGLLGGLTGGLGSAVSGFGQ